MMPSHLNNLHALNHELRRLSFGLGLSFNSSMKLSAFFAKRFFKSAGWLLWFLLEQPQLWEKIGPDKKKEIPSSSERAAISPYIHPPSFNNF